MDLLARMGLDPGLVDAAIADPTTGDEVLAEHRRVTQAGGFGVPTLFFPDGQCLFGPVLIDPPRRGSRRAALGRRGGMDRPSRTCMRSSGRRHRRTRSRSRRRSSRTWRRGTGSASTEVASSTSPRRPGQARKGAPLTEPTAAAAEAAAGPDQRAAAQERVVDLLDAEWSAIAGLLAGLRR